ncbi:MAG: plasmid mobilization relaxosome protein MobC [Novosphingobium sp.]
MSDRLTIRLSTGAEAPGIAMIEEVAGRHGMSSSQWVRSLIAREMTHQGQTSERAGDASLRAYADAVSDEALFTAHREFEAEHPSARDAHLRPGAPKIPSAMRIRMCLDANEAIALERAGEPYAMTIQQVATTVLRRWIGLNKRPPSSLHRPLGAIRAEIRRIGVNVNQIAHAVNKLLVDVRLRRQDDVIDQLAEFKALKAAIDTAMKQINDCMGLERSHWSIANQMPSDRLEMLPHPSVEHVYPDDDPP